MKKLVIVIVVVGAALTGVYYGGFFGTPGTPASGEIGVGGDGPGRGGAAGRRGGGAGGFAGGGRFGRAPMTVELAQVARASIDQEITVVGNLIGDATVTVVPRVAGRLQDISVRLGDRVRRGQRLAKIEDFEIVEQVKQAEAAGEVSLATIRQREADLQLSLTSVERSRNLYQRQLLPKQTLDDNEARYQASVAQLDLARAQNNQSKARLDELRINLANTIITSPVNGFVARRAADPGAFVSQNAPIADVVDITSVRLVANIVEKDLTRLVTGNSTTVEVDAFPGETFLGRIARVSPVLDPATRTAAIEIEIPNTDFRLKPGMYARVRIKTNTKKDAMVVPATALVDLGGRRGVFVPLNNNAAFRMVQVGVEQLNQVEILSGLAEGDTVITTGSGSLRDGDTFLLAGRGVGRGEGRGVAGQTSRGSGPSATAGPPQGGARGQRQGFGAPEGASRGREGQRVGGDGSGRRGATPPAPPIGVSP